MADRCRGITKDGNPCAARPMPGRDVCPWHAPDLADRRQAWSAKGGAQRSNQARAKKHLPTQLLSNDELISYLTVVFKGVIAGKMEPKIGTAAAAIAKTMTDIATAGALDDLQAEIETLKATLRRGGAA